jgi:hypothetical protein
VATANCVALVGQNLVNQWALRGSIGTRLIDRSCWGCYGLIVAGTALLWVFQVTVHPGIVLSLLVASLVSLVVLVGSQSALQLASTFPELLRLPVFRWVIR